jgi:hypothetical protein
LRTDYPTTRIQKKLNLSPRQTVRTSLSLSQTKTT